MKVTRKSILSGETRTKELDITIEQIANWESGTLIQNAMSNLSPEDREFFLTGVTKEEWENTFKEDSE